MTKLYEMRATVILKVEANDYREAGRTGEELIAEVEAALPTGATLEQADGKPDLTIPQLI